MAWSYLFYQYWVMTTLPMSEMWMPPYDSTVWQWMDFVLVYVMWAVMMVAMMLPSAMPMMLVYAKICQQRYQTTRLYIFLFSMAYLLVWFGFSVVLTILQWQMYGLHFLTPMMDNQSKIMAAVIFLLVGVLFISWGVWLLQIG